jgi:hypothetical protein
VRDYGTGLSDEDVLGLFSTIGASTKRNSNEYNGVFGIGRMAGLAYSDSFQVTSYFNGVESSYLITTDTGIPKTMIFGSEPTDEPNGLELQVNVKQQDIKKFVERAVDVYRYFDTQPESNTVIDIPERKDIITGKDWYLESTSWSSSRYHNKPLAIMGNVAYEIQVNGLPSTVYHILNQSIRLEVPLGAISITPGRESLSMDSRTTEYLLSRVKTVQKEAAQVILDNLKTEQNEYQKALRLTSILVDLPYNLLDTTSCLIPLPKMLKYVNKKISFAEIHNIPDDISITVYRNGYVAGQSLKTLELGYNRFYITKNTHFMIGDSRTGVADAAKTYKQTLVGCSVVVIKPTKWDKNKISEQYAKMIETIKLFGGPTYVKASDYITTVPKVPGVKQNIQAKDFHILSIMLHSDDVYIRRAGLLSEYKHDKFYYVETSGTQVLNMKSDKLAKFLRFEKIYKKQNPKGENFMICGVPKLGLKNIQNDPRFIPLDNNLAHLAKDVSFVDKSEIYTFEDLIRYFGTVKLKGVSKKLGEHLLAETITGLILFRDRHELSDGFNAKGVSDLFKISSVSPKVPLSMKDIGEMYPLLKALFLSNIDVDDVVRYIGLEDVARNAATKMAA